MTLYQRGSSGEMVRQIQKALHLLPDGIFGIVTEEAVRKFQLSNGLKSDGIVGPATLALLIPQRWKKSCRTISEIIVHCTATPEGKPYTVDDIRRWHKAQGWSDIGYHYVVYLDGSVHEGRDVDVAGAHCAGQNAHSIGVAYVGGVAADGRTPKDTRTDAQRRNLVILLKALRRIYPQARIYGHRDFAEKACPSFDAWREYKTI
jgi:N-acetylmuramoyl-L-alanine amidase